MKFILEIDLNTGAMEDGPAEELARILRYWAGNVKHYGLAQGENETVYDSTYSPVGSWLVAGA